MAEPISTTLVSAASITTEAAPLVALQQNWTNHTSQDVRPPQFWGSVSNKYVAATRPKQKMLFCRRDLPITPISVMLKVTLKASVYSFDDQFLLSILARAKTHSRLRTLSFFDVIKNLVHWTSFDHANVQRLFSWHARLYQKDSCWFSKQQRRFSTTTSNFSHGKVFTLLYPCAPTGTLAKRK